MVSRGTTRKRLAATVKGHIRWTIRPRCHVVAHIISTIFSYFAPSVMAENTPKHMNSSRKYSMKSPPIQDIVKFFASGIEAADALRPRAVNVRSGEPYSAGIGPHTEKQTVQLVVDQWRSQSGCYFANQVMVEVPYPTNPRSKCDLCIGERPAWGWAIEIKMLRLMGDNGKPNDNMLMHILSPYPTHRSALTDCQKLLDSQLKGRKALLVFPVSW